MLIRGVNDFFIELYCKVRFMVYCKLYQFKEIPSDTQNFVYNYKVSLLLVSLFSMIVL